MTEKELINCLSSFEHFIDDDYGGYYESIIQFSDGKLERALTSMSALKIIDEFNKLQQENQQLKAKIKTYEDPEDLTLMFMYCNEKAKDKIKELEEQLKTKHNGFMASVNESCDLAEEIQKYKEVIDKLNVKLNQYKNDLKAYQKQDTINHRAISIGLIGVKIRAFEDILKEVE